MLIKGIRAVAIGVRVVWLTAIISVISLALLPHALPSFDREMYVVRGSSMQPAIPLGSAIFVRHVEPGSIAIGDVITFRASNDTIVTHRVIGTSYDTELAFSTRGDASVSADPLAVSASALVGQVDVYVPMLGFVIVALSTTVGALAALGLIGGLLLTVIFLDELLVNARRSTQPLTGIARSRGEVAAEPLR